MKPDKHLGGTRPALTLCLRKIESAGNEDSAINGSTVYFSHLEAMRSRWSAAGAKPVALHLDFG
jgi:hypothetical protein